MYVNGHLVGGTPTPLKNMKVSWDYDIPNIWRKKSHVPNHQPAINWGTSQVVDEASRWHWPHSRGIVFQHDKPRNIWGPYGDISE